MSSKSGSVPNETDTFDGPCRYPFLGNEEKCDLYSDLFPTAYAIYRSYFFVLGGLSALFIGYQLIRSPTYKTRRYISLGVFGCLFLGSLTFIARGVDPFGAGNKYTLRTVELIHSLSSGFLYSATFLVLLVWASLLHDYGSLKLTIPRSYGIASTVLLLILWVSCGILFVLNSDIERRDEHSVYIGLVFFSFTSMTSSILGAFLYLGINLSRKLEQTTALPNVTAMRQNTLQSDATEHSKLHQPGGSVARSKTEGTATFSKSSWWQAWKKAFKKSKILKIIAVAVFITIPLIVSELFWAIVMVGNLSVPSGWQSYQMCLAETSDAGVPDCSFVLPGYHWDQFFVELFQSSILVGLIWACWSSMGSSSKQREDSGHGSLHDDDLAYDVDGDKSEDDTDHSFIGTSYDECFIRQHSGRQIMQVARGPLSDDDHTRDNESDMSFDQESLGTVNVMRDSSYDKL